MMIKNIRTDNDSMGVTPDISMPGFQLLFFWHSHVSRSLNTADRRSFSHADIDFLRRPACLKLNFTSFADCGNKQYALVITDLSKAQNFFNNNNRAKIEDNYWTTGGGDMQQVDERCVKNILGSAATNGIAFYVSINSPSFSTWTLINP